MTRKKAIPDMYGAWAAGEREPVCHAAIFGVSSDFSSSSKLRGKWRYSDGICSSYRWPLNPAPGQGVIFSSFFDTEAGGAANHVGIDTVVGGVHREHRMEIFLLQSPALLVPAFVDGPGRKFLGGLGPGGVIVAGSAAAPMATLIMHCSSFTFSPGRDFDFSGPGGQGATLTIASDGL